MGGPSFDENIYGEHASLFTTMYIAEGLPRVPVCFRLFLLSDRSGDTPPLPLVDPARGKRSENHRGPERNAQSSACVTLACGTKDTEGTRIFFLHAHCGREDNGTGNAESLG